jgi:hypothetical protein
MAERTRAGRCEAAAVAAAAVLLSWVAFYNGYPLVFSDTGTYLGQALQRSLGWDRPIFYSFLLLTLHWSITLWAVPLVQGGIIAWLVWLTLRCLGAPGLARFAAVVLFLAVATALPWFVAWIIPDVFTGAVVLGLWLLGAAPERLGRWERVVLALVTTGAITVHQSHVPLGAGLVIVLVAGRPLLRQRLEGGWHDIAWLVAPVVAAGCAIVLVNLAAFGRPSLSPGGANFLLARMLYDGPAAATLVEACPEKGWALCAHLAELPPASNRFPSSDHFLWSPASPFARMGHPRDFAAEAGEIVAETLRRHGLWQAERVASNAASQLLRFQTGEGTDLAPWLGVPGPEPLIAEFLPADLSAFRGARQATGTLGLLRPASLLHQAVIVVSLPLALGAALLFLRRGQPAGALLVLAILAALFGNAILAGGLSAVHDRYTARLAWLLPFSVAACLAGARGRAAAWGAQPSRS